jgi:hypothetical protein
VNTQRAGVARRSASARYLASRARAGQAGARVEREASFVEPDPEPLGRLGGASRSSGDPGAARGRRARPRGPRAHAREPGAQREQLQPSPRRRSPRPRPVRLPGCPRDRGRAPPPPPADGDRSEGGARRARRRSPVAPRRGGWRRHGIGTGKRDHHVALPRPRLAATTPASARWARPRPPRQGGRRLRERFGRRGREQRRVRHPRAQHRAEHAAMQDAALVGAADRACVPRRRCGRAPGEQPGSLPTIHEPFSHGDPVPREVRLAGERMVAERRAPGRR